LNCFVRRTAASRLAATLFRAAWAAAALAALPAAAQDGQAALQRFEYVQVHMGVDFRLLFYAPDAPSANRAAEAAFARVAELDAIMSDYEPESELMQLCATAGKGRAVPVSADLWRVLTHAQQLAEATDGAFDVSVGPFVRLWRQSRRQRKLPSPQLLEQARQAVGYQHVRLLPESRSVELTQPAMQLDLGGIAMGYAADAALQELREQGMPRALVDASGDIVVGDPPPDAAGWRIGVAPLDADQPPSRFLLLAHAAVTTSGDAFQHVEIGGQRYSHIIDPATGLGLTQPRSVTVIAPDGTTADSLATALCVLGPERGMEFIGKVPGAQALFIWRDGEQVCSRETPGFSARELPAGGEE
jgi:thiamine biosynthesis lipoprotein